MLPGVFDPIGKVSGKAYQTAYCLTPENKRKSAAKVVAPGCLEPLGKQAKTVRHNAGRKQVSGLV